jgi:hypothetical protein
MRAIYAYSWRGTHLCVRHISRWPIWSFVTWHTPGSAAYVLLDVVTDVAGEMGANELRACWLAQVRSHSWSGTHLGHRRSSRQLHTSCWTWWVMWQAKWGASELWGFGLARSCNARDVALTWAADEPRVTRFGINEMWVWQYLPWRHRAVHLAMMWHCSSMVSCSGGSGGPWEMMWQVASSITGELEVEGDSRNEWQFPTGSSHRWLESL